jgi:hypothetical protein
VAEEPSTGLFGSHNLSDFAFDALKAAFGIESKGGALDVGGADDHAGETAFARRIFGGA